NRYHKRAKVAGLLLLRESCVGAMTHIQDTQHNSAPPGGQPAGQGAINMLPANSNEGSVDLAAVFSGMWRRKLLMVTIFAVIVAAAAAFVFTATPKYTAISKVLIIDRAANYRDPNLGAAQQNSTTRVGEREVRSQAEVIRSRDLAVRVAKALKLNQVREFVSPGASSSPMAKFEKMLGLGKQAQNNGNDPNAVERRVVGRLTKNLTAYPVQRSKVIKVEYESPNPATAAAVANAYTKLYVNWTQEVQRDDARGATGWLSGQIKRLQDKLAEEEADVEAFRARAGLVRGQSQNSTLAQDELSELNRQIALAAAARAEAEAKADAIRRMLQETGSVAASNDVINSNLIQRLREQEIALGRRLAELRTTYLSSHPRIVSARQEIRDVRREIRVEALKIVEGLEQQAAVTTAREASLRASLNELKAKSSASKQDEVKLRAMERKAKASREQLELYIKRQTDADSRQDLVAQAPGARIIAAAAVPSKPSFPKKAPTLLVAVAAAIAIALLVAFLLEAINPRHRPLVMGVVAQAPSMPPQEPAAPAPQPLQEAPARSGHTLNLAGIAASGTQPAAVPTAAIDPAPPLQPASPAVPVGLEPVMRFGAPEQPLASPEQTVSVTKASAAPVPVQTELQPLPVQPVEPPPTVHQPVSAAPAILPEMREMPVMALLSEMPGDVAASAYAVIAAPDSAYASGIKQLARDVASRLGHLTNICLYVSPSTDLGTGAAISAGLARSFSGFGLKTIVVDATFTNSEFLSAFGIGPGFGLMEFLNGNVSFSDAIVSDGTSAAHIMTSGLAGADGLASVAPDKIDVTFKALRQAYDVVIISGPSLPENPWVRDIASAADFTLLAFPESAGQDGALAACRQLAGVTTSELGIVLSAPVAQPARHAA
ncbi:MAG: Wzz/FepE/Etk N-terminal domain-containing protein, partial [Pseudomonadota bacterium]